jgi:membrane protein required for colicin V production
MSVEIGWVDGAMLGVLGLSLVVGALRGLVFEVLSLLGWLVAFFAAQWLAPLLAPHLPAGSPGSVLNRATSFALAFIATLIVWSLLSRLLRSLVRATPLAALDRVLGAAFGLLRGGIVLLAVVWLVASTPARASTAWQASAGADWLESMLRGLRPLLPTNLENLLPASAAELPKRD